jgi:hypothetical protein
MLKSQLSNYKGVDLRDVIESMCFRRPDGERVQTSSTSDITAKTAMSYRQIGNRMSDEWYLYLIDRHETLQEEIEFFENSIKRLSGKLPEVMQDMIIEKLLWDELVLKYCVSRAMIGKYRQKAIKELDGLYELRDTQVESYILS